MIPEMNVQLLISKPRSSAPVCSFLKRSEDCALARMEDVASDRARCESPQAELPVLVLK